MNGQTNGWGLGLGDLSERDRANSWKQLVAGFVVAGGLFGSCMVLIWWLVG